MAELKYLTFPQSGPPIEHKVKPTRSVIGMRVALLVRNIPRGNVAKKARSVKLSPSTFYNLKKGKTKIPSSLTNELALHAFGYELTITSTKRR